MANKAYSDSMYSLPLHVFDGKDFHEWETRLKWRLRADPHKGVHKAIDPCESPTEGQKYKAMEIIMMSLSNSVLRYVIDEEIPINVMEKLRGMYGTCSSADRIELRSRLASTTLAKMKYNMDSYIAEVASIVAKLNSPLKIVDEEEHVSWLLHGLPVTYAAARAGVNALIYASGDETPDVGKISNVLRQEGRKEAAAFSEKSVPVKQSTAMVAETKNDDGPTQQTTQAMCFRCKKVGHLAKNCTRYGKDRPKCTKCNRYGHEAEKCTSGPGAQRPSNQQPSDGTPAPTAALYALGATSQYRGHSALVAASESAKTVLPDTSSKCVEFILDSGATSHFVNENSFLVDEVPAHFEIGSCKRDTTAVVRSRGKLFVRNQAGQFVLDVVYSPDLGNNLLSVNVLRRNGCEVVFGDSVCIKRKSDGVIIAKAAETPNGLYKVQFEIQQQLDRCESAYVTTPSADTLLWHRRFGHICGDALRKFLGVRDARNLNVSTCGVCAEAKQARSSCSETRYRAARLLEIIHVDTIGPLPLSIENQKYVLSFLDDYSHYVVTFVIKSRSYTADAFMIYEKQATAKFNLKVHTVRCDNAPEFIAGRMGDYCKQQGIILKPAEPYTHEHNGTAERMNRTIMERTRALLFESKLPKCFWNYAVYAAVYLINRTPTRVMGWITPYEIWNNRPPKNNHLCVFGSVARVLVPYEKRKKIDEKSKDHIVVGFGDTGYELYNVVTREIIVSSNVEVDESKNYSYFEIEEFFPSEEVILEEIDDPMALLSQEGEISYEEAINGPEAKEWKRAGEYKARLCAHGDLEKKIIYHPNFSTQTIIRSISR